MQKFTCTHPLAAWLLQHVQSQGAFAAGHHQGVALRLQDLPRRPLATDRLRGPDLVGLRALVAIQGEGTTGEWVEGAHAPGDHVGRQRPVDRCFGLLDLVGIGDAGLGLRGAGQATAGGHLQSFDDQPSAQAGQAVVQHGRGVVGTDGLALDQQHVAGVQSRIHLHDGDAGLGIAGLDRAVDGGGPTPARQQRAVDVEAAQARQVQRPLLQDQAIGGHHHHVGGGGEQGVARSGRLVGILAIQAQAVRLAHRDAVLLRQLLDGRGLQLHAATGRAVRLGEHDGHVEPGGQDRGQGFAGKLGRARKRHLHARGHQAPCSSRWRLTSLVLMRLRLSGDRYSTNTLPLRWSSSCCTHTPSSSSPSNS